MGTHFEDHNDQIFLDFTLSQPISPRGRKDSRISYGNVTDTLNALISDCFENYLSRKDVTKLDKIVKTIKELTKDFNIEMYIVKNWLRGEKYLVSSKKNIPITVLENMIETMCKEYFE
uniref:Uncharacterized protein n=1 Tax=viral metagenome TaxID=1070528 RepID=A0A6C0JPK6_9ZZZZ